MLKASTHQSESKVTALLKGTLFLIVFITMLMLSGRLSSFFPVVYHFMVYGPIGCAAGLLAVGLFIKWDKLTLASVGLAWQKRWFGLFLLGCLIGAALFTPMVIALTNLTALQIKINPAHSTVKLLWTLLPVLPLALMEEIGFRTYPQVKLKEAYGIWVSQIVIALIFGAYHILNGWSVSLSFSGPFVWAFIFGLAALWSKGIALSTGIHFSLNVLQSLFGMKGKDSLFQLYYAEGVSKTEMATTGHIGLALQVAVLAIGLTATYYFAKCKSNYTAGSYK